MRSFAYWSLSLCVIAAAAGCGSAKSSSGGSGTVKQNPRTTTSAQRAIEEADIIQVDGGLLYAMSKSGTVSIVDIATPGRLALLGQTTLAGEPFEMYRRGDFLIAMSNDAVGADGRVTVTRTGVDAGGGALVSVLDVRDPTRLVEVATLKVPGEIADSRVVGNVLYVASYENLLCYGCGNLPRTMVTTFNIASPTAIALIEQVSFENTAPTTDTTVWGSNWKRSIVVTSQRLYLGGHVELDPNGYGSADEGLIDVLDISDPNGRLKVGVRIIVAGAILSRWQVDEWQGVLRVVSQRGVGRAVNGLSAPEVDTFQVDSAQAVRPLGHTTINTGRPEGLRAVRFDGARAYAITYATPQRTDPLFVIDLAEPRGAAPARPAVDTGLHVPPGAARRPRPGAWRRRHRPERQPQRLAVRRRRPGRASTAGACRLRAAVPDRAIHGHERDGRGPGSHPEGIPRVRGRRRGRPVLGAAPVFRVGHQL